MIFGMTEEDMIWEKSIQYDIELQFLDAFPSL